MDKLLSDKEVKKLAGRGTKIIIYPELKNMTDIDQVFGNSNKVILLYVNEQDPASITGHWVALLRTRRNGKTHYEVSDSYGKEIDAHLDDFPQGYRNSLDQEYNFLSRLLYNKKVVDPNSVVEFNEIPLQATKDNVSTCGRWSALRAYFNKIPLEDWQKVWTDLKHSGNNIDSLIVKLSDQILNKG